MKNWTNYEYKSNGLLTSELLINTINNFWDDKISQMEENNHILMILRVKFENNNIASICDLQRINKEDKDLFIDVIINKFAEKTDIYFETPISSIIFSYGIREGQALSQINYSKPKEINYQTWFRSKLPIALKPEDYGIIIYKKDNITSVKLDKKCNVIINQEIKDGLITNHVTLFRNNVNINSWEDTQTNADIPNTFTRIIGKSTYYYEDGELILSKHIKYTKPLSKTKKEKTRANKFIVMDLETINNEGKMTPYLLSWYDGYRAHSYYLSDYENFLELLKAVFEEISFYNNYTIYFHNFAKFDSYFILKYLVELGQVDPIINKGRIISLNFMYEFNNKIISLSFHDSYQLLPGSLRNLAKSFNVKNQKGIFPYLFNDINYKGAVPDFSHFVKLTNEEYNTYKIIYLNKTWNFRNEAIKYCELDCKALYQVLKKFNSLIFKKFKLNVHNYPTLPSLAFKIFRTHYLPKKSIHMLFGDIADDIRQSYTGGSVDMFIPKNEKDETIYAYDVNSLYPYVMKQFDMPIGSPTYFTGDILKKMKKPFGFFYCKIIAPDNLEHPIIQTHLKTKSGIRTVSPVGEWSDWLFSEEIYNAEKYGYKFEIEKGYIFKKDKIFSKYVNELYNLRLEYPKTDPMNYIAKILLNSLYGRFGMDDKFTFSDILHKEESEKFITQAPENVKDLTEIGTEHFLIESQSQSELLNTYLDNGSEIHNVNIAVASAITAYARIHMSQFKNNTEYKLFYTSFLLLASCF